MFQHAELPSFNACCSSNWAVEEALQPEAAADQSGLPAFRAGFGSAGSLQWPRLEVFSPMSPQGPSIMSISRESPEPFGASWPTAQFLGNCAAPKPEHHEHQPGSPATLSPQSPSIMSISRDSPEPFGASWATAQFLSNCAAPKPEHHEHQPGSPATLSPQSPSIMSISQDSPEHHGQRPSFCATAPPQSPSIMSISREALATLSPQSPSI